VVTDGEQSRQHFVHGFLEFVDGIDFEHKVEMGIRNNRYKAMVPTVTGALKLKGRVHGTEARFARAHTARKLKITMPGPMTIVDTIADRHYGDRVKLAFAFADLLNQESRALAGRRVAGANRDLRHGHRYPLRACDGGDARKRHAKVSFDVDGERFEWGDVQDSTPSFCRRCRFEHQSVQAPEKRGQRLATPGRRQNECRFSSGDCGPSEPLGFGGRWERGGKPRAHRRMK